MDIKQFVTFRIDDHLLGVDILSVREINNFLEITTVQHAPDHVLGLINLRGQTVTVFDLGILLGLAPRKFSEDSHNVIYKAEPVGLLVDRIGDVLAVEEQDIEPPPANLDGIGGEFIVGVVELENELLMILEPGKILESRSRDNGEKI